MDDFAFNPKAPVVIPTVEVKPTGSVKSWSFSALKTFEKCPYETFLKSVKRLKQESGDAAARGNQIHDLAEEYVRGNIEFPNELEKMKVDYEWLHDTFISGDVILEDEWGYNKDWDPTGWMAEDVWNRTKLDAMVFESETSALVIDHKTGRRFGNELKHGEQLMLYAIVAFLRYPKLQHIRVANWYIDHNEKLERNYTREAAMMFLPRWTERGITMTTATDFPPKPSISNCKWCYYKKSGACEWAN